MQGSGFRVRGSGVRFCRVYREAPPQAPLLVERSTFAHLGVSRVLLDEDERVELALVRGHGLLVGPLLLAPLLAAAAARRRHLYGKRNSIHTVFWTSRGGFRPRVKLC